MIERFFSRERKYHSLICTNIRQMKSECKDDFQNLVCNINIFCRMVSHGKGKEEMNKKNYK